MSSPHSRLTFKTLLSNCKSHATTSRGFYPRETYKKELETAKELPPLLSYALQNCNFTSLLSQHLVVHIQVRLQFYFGLVRHQFYFGLVRHLFDSGLLGPGPTTAETSSNTLHQTATHCTTLQRTAIHCDTLQRTATQSTVGTSH